MTDDQKEPGPFKKPNDKLAGIQFLPGEDGRLRGEYLDTFAYGEFWHLQTDWQDKVYEQYLPRLTNGEISPLHLYMLLYDMNDKEVSLRTGLRKGLIRKHKTPGGFMKATVRQLIGYGNVFGVPVAAFFCFAHPSMADVRLSVVENRDGTASLVKPGNERNEWNFLRAPTRRSL